MSILDNEDGSPKRPRTVNLTDIREVRAENERLLAAVLVARQAIEYSIDMGCTDPAGVLLQAMNKCDLALGRKS